jgi:hypothetical protein
MNCHPSHQQRCGVLQSIRIECPPSPQPSPPGEGARWAGRKPFESYSSRLHLVEISRECFDETNAAISVQVFQNTSSALPLLGERVGVRADQPLTLLPIHRHNRPRVVRQPMRRTFLKLTKNGIANHLRRASQPRIPEPKFFDAETREIGRPFGITLMLIREALSPRRGGATDARREMVAPSSAFSSSRFTCRTPVGGERGDRRASFQDHSIRVPSPGGEGQGEGGPTSQSLCFL